MTHRRATLVLVVLLALSAACRTLPGASRAEPLPPLASQRALAERFPAEETAYTCWSIDALADQFDDSDEETMAIDGSKIDVPNPSFTSVYPLNDDQSAFVLHASPEADRNYYVLVEDVVYWSIHAPSAPLHLVRVCALPQHQDQITGRKPSAHHRRLVAYLAAWKATDEAKAAAVAARETPDGDDDGGDDDEAADGAPRWTDKQLATIARVRTLVSFTFEARAAGPGQPLSLGIDAVLGDGSTMAIGYGSPIFGEVFHVGVNYGATAMAIDVTPLDEDGAKIAALEQYQEVTYSFEDDQRNFNCGGANGADGPDQNWSDSGAMYYVGQRGEDGPDLTVEITTVGGSTTDGNQILRYRLTCAERSSVFTTSATSKVHVATLGGNGGYGIQRANHAGTNGGDGGDGGDITVIVDPSVRRYDLSTETRGGTGGRASKPVTVDSRVGSDGSDGDVEERRADVVIP